MNRQIKTVLFLIAAALPIFSAQIYAADKTIIGVYTNGKSIEQTSKIFNSDEFEVYTILNESVADFCKGAGNVLVIPADEIIHHSVRKDIHDFLTQSGSLIILNADAMNYEKFTISEPVYVAGSEDIFDSAKDFDEKKIIKAKKSNLKISKKQDSVYMCTDEGIEIGGSAFVEIDGQFDGELLSKCIEVEAKGDIQFDILTVRIIDDAGSSWVGFAEMSDEWRKYKFPLADMLAENGSSKDIGEVKSEAIKKIQIGLETKVIWGEAGGEFALRKVSLISYNKNRYPLSGDIIRYRSQFKAVGADFPEWLFSPIVKAQAVESRYSEFAGHILVPQGRVELEGAAVSLDTTLTYPGGNTESYLDVIKRNAFRQIPLLCSRTPDGGKNNLAVLNVYSDGDYAGASVGLFGLNGLDYENELIASAIRNVARYMSKSPKILDCTGDTKASKKAGEFDFLYRVYVYNPAKKNINGTFALDLAGGKLTSQKTQKLPGGEVSQVVLNCGKVGEDFPFNNFAINLTLNTSNGNDVLNHNINVEQTLVEAAEFMIDMQAVNFIDSAYTHWFYSDAYAARMLRGLGEYLNDQKYINAGMRWADAMVATQLETGAYPMGYGMKRDIYYIADNGSIALAVAQLASFAKDIERRALLDSVAKAFDWRRSYLVTDERSKELEEKYGKGAVGTQVGNYGVGMVGQDHVTGSNEVYEKAQPEYRGVWYTMSCTVGFPAAMTALQKDDRYIDSVHADAEIYLDRELTVTGSYAPEGVLWMYKYVQDKELKQRLEERLIDGFIGYFPSAAERFWMYQGSRQTLLINPLVYAMRNIENSTRSRAAVLESVIGLCGDYSPYSMMRVAKGYPKATFSKANNEATMYLNFGSFGLIELLNEGSTMLKGSVCK